MKTEFEKKLTELELKVWRESKKQCHDKTFDKKIVAVALDLDTYTVSMINSKIVKKVFSHDF